MSSGLPARQSSVPPAMRAASEWAWRLLVVAAFLVAVYYAFGMFSEIVIPLIVGLLLTALLSSLSRLLTRWMPRGVAAGITVLGTIIVVLALLALVGATISSGFADLVDQLGDGIQQIRDWIRNTLGVSDTQFQGYLDELRRLVANLELGSMAARAGVTVTHVAVGTFVTLFSLFFFLYDGPRIWGWIVQLFPRTARDRVDSSGGVAWGQLTAYTRATVLVAAVDAVGITVGALILRVPFAAAIGVLVFLLSFIPLVGALISGAVAVLLALVAHGPVTALIMLAVVIGVQQLESHALQPFILGRSVKVHPLGVIVAITTGSILLGLFGTLIAVPTVAVVKSVMQHLFALSRGEPDPTVVDTGIGDDPDVTATTSAPDPKPDGAEVAST